MMYLLWELLIEPSAKKAFHKTIELLNNMGKYPLEEVIDIIFDGNEKLRNKEYDKIRETIKSILKSPTEKIECEKAEKKFEYLCHRLCPKEREKIEFTRRVVIEKLPVALKSLENPLYEILKLLMKIHLPEIEDVLEEDKKEEGSKLFRRGGPIWIDFEEDCFIKREKKAKRVLQCLKNHNIHVVCGAPASGKSNFVKYLGYELAKNNDCVFYVGLKEYDMNFFYEDIKRVLNSEGCVLIIDDAHLDTSNIIQSLIVIAKNKSSKLIISTRLPSKEEYKTHISSRISRYIKNKEYSTELDSEEILDELLEKYSEKNKVEIPPHVYSKIKKGYGKDLWILYWALKAYNSETEDILEEKIYENIKKERFDEFEYKHDKNVEYVEKIFYYISLFSQYEFPIEKKFILERVDGDKFEKIRQSKEFIKIEKDRIMLHHSSVAKIYLKAFYFTKYRNFDPVEYYRNHPEKFEQIKSKFRKYQKWKFYDQLEKPEINDEVEVLTEYIKNNPERGIELISALGDRISQTEEIVSASGGFILAKPVLNKVKLLIFPEIYKNIVQGINLSENLYHIGSCVWAIYRARCRLVASLLLWKSDIGKLINKMDNCKELWYIWWLLQYVSVIDEAISQTIVEKINKKALKQKIINCKELDIIGDCINEILGVDKKICKNFLKNYFNPDELKDMIINSKLAGVERFISSIMGVDSRIGKELIPTIAQKINNHDSKLVDISWCIHGVGEKFAKRLIKQMDIDEMKRKIIISKKIRSIAFIILDIRIADREWCKELIDRIGTKELKKKISECPHLGNVGLFVVQVFMSNSEIGERLLSTVSKKIENCNDLRGITACFREIRSWSERLAEELVNQIDISKLKNKITEGEFEDIGSFMHEIIKADNIIGESLIDFVAKRIDGSEDLYDIRECIDQITGANENLGYKLVNRIDIKKVINLINSSPKQDEIFPFFTIEGVLRAIIKADKTKKKDLIEHVKRKDIDFSKL